MIFKEIKKYTRMFQVYKKCFLFFLMNNNKNQATAESKVVSNNCSMLWSSWGVHGVPGSWISLPSCKTMVVVVSSGGGALSFLLFLIFGSFGSFLN